MRGRAKVVNMGEEKKKTMMANKEETRRKKGKEKSVPLVYEKQFQYLNTDGETIGKVEKKLRIHREVKATLKKGSQAGEMIYSADGKELGRVRILYARTIGQATYLDCVKELLKKL